MKAYQSNLKITDEFKRRLAQQQSNNSLAFGVMALVQLLVASFLITGIVLMS